MMTPRVAVVIPVYNEAKHIGDVLRGIPPEVEQIIVVDDASTDNSVEVIQQAGDARVSLIQHEDNRGVGGAVCSGYRRALDFGSEIVVKVDGDGQMDIAKLSNLITPIVHGKADYVKGARFSDWPALRQMPVSRLVGNLGLSLGAKIVSGYWNTFDPTNGFTAIHGQVLGQLRLDRISQGYFFETDMLIHLYYLQAVIADVQMAARYSNEKSNLSPLKMLFSFPGKLVQALIKRVLWRYFIYDFTACSLFLVLGLMLFLGGGLFGTVAWILGGIHGTITTPGTVMLAVVPLLLGFQLLLQALVLDVGNTPKVSIHLADERVFGGTGVPPPL